ncbi:MAG: hypothetical protein H7333_11270 [Bdellovibrionales bacterium]|nr:hypothetical protein [Oligoflexia bacterium]
MVLRLLLLSLFLHSGTQTARAEVPDPRLKEAFYFLSQTKTGAAELARADALKIPILMGRVSRTDITATRFFQGDEESLKFKTEVVVAEGKDPVFQALDLAHELVHATQPKNNPFDPSLDLTTYLKRGIEGSGGEADAIAQECRVGQELIEGPAKSQLKVETVQLIVARCQFVWKTAEDEVKWRQSFYFLGQHYRDFLKSVTQMNLSEEKKEAWFKKVDTRSPMFASAVAHKPYPLALLEEYVDITTKICEKTKAARSGRVIATLALLTERCNSVGVSLIP